MARNEAQEKRLDLLLEKFREDSVQYKDLKVGEGYEEKRATLRSFMNIRMPEPMPEEVLALQDEFLTQEAQERGIVFSDDIPTVAAQYGSRHAFADQISIWQGDITRLHVDAIVNAANSQLLGCFVPCHRCIDNAIHSAAGIQLRAECSRYMNRRRSRYGIRYEEPVGQAVLTGGYNLPAKYVIHTVGPIVGGALNGGHRRKLRACYENVLQCCVENGIRSVAFCCISTGEFHFPNEEAAKLAVKAVTDFLERNAPKLDRIIFTVFKDVDRELYEKEMGGNS